ncbi:hypothetical protein A3H22_04305 [Candidatus Peribacteria bacterium RIFCSPLOWO2_12_FULL_55_15]|nr:MAG: hypothetical protein A3D12_01765 [Candidatus Peribacteria bacterium RIFCSPHIGHO2_02_FULL_55_24]OGJ64311.1 MAG: hypothetical protein A3E47_03115 [Candidatus Peribacteria bacterium RIFCSPHIGHO2_12_FULL_54_10]OGJ68747.1 MAG: hypothetical protein A3H90_00345 [Candidatus Peribacteria bacterium RIFCSPLOWO2_02_FULL_55_36]OGJ71244.1 MAG: hypothetical protein A3H22_04305 [Candidatus Peribacteria bacterium RIFCSPLOWO2_12_FULL_55_15]
MSVRRIFFFTIILLLFGASVWFGAVMRNSRNAQEQAVQPGWCCMLDQRQCIIAPGEADCRIGRGSTFSFDRAACEAVCKATAGRSIP